jgi:hypothetical protein
MILPSNEQESTENEEFSDSEEFPDSGVAAIESNFWEYNNVDSPLAVHTYKKHKGQLEDTPQFPTLDWNDSPSPTMMNDSSLELPGSCLFNINMWGGSLDDTFDDTSLGLPPLVCKGVKSRAYNLKARMFLAKQMRKVADAADDEANNFEEYSMKFTKSRCKLNLKVGQLDIKAGDCESVISES